jgi:NADPH-dependent curcumin reductase CurA
MTTFTTLKNHQVRLASRPVGLPTLANWSFTEEAVAEPGPGGVLVKTLYLSLGPAMRGWMNEGKSYIPPVEINAVHMKGSGLNTVRLTKNWTPILKVR